MFVSVDCQSAKINSAMERTGNDIVKPRRSCYLSSKSTRWIEDGTIAHARIGDDSKKLIVHSGPAHFKIQDFNFLA
jgi:hypothetical protein